jgi:glycosyltransferase involved in cell wall biosynthesis
MKIVHVFHHYWPVVGGLERVIQSIAEELVKLGHENRVVTSKIDAEDRPSEEVINGIYVHRVKALRLYFQDLTIPMEIPIGVLKEADVVICWSQNSYFVYRVCREAKKLRKFLVVQFLGVDYLKDHYNPLLRVPGYVYQKLITKKMSGLADIALVTNEYEKELLRRKYSINAIVLPHGIDEKYLRLPNMAQKFRVKYNVDEKIVTYIGRIHPTKGLILLIKAFTNVAKEESNVTLIIAGSGDETYLKKCLKIAEKANIKDKIRVLGYISEEDKIGLIDASDVIVIPTRHAGESYPIIINEVLARGKKFVMTKGSIASKWIEESGIARVVNADPRELAQAITDELGSKNSIKVNNKKTVKIRTWRDVAYRFLELLQQILEGEGINKELGE